MKNFFTYPKDNSRRSELFNSLWNSDINIMKKEDFDKIQISKESTKSDSTKSYTPTYDNLTCEYVKFSANIKRKYSQSSQEEINILIYSICNEVNNFLHEYFRIVTGKENDYEIFLRMLYTETIKDFLTTDNLIMWLDSITENIEFIKSGCEFDKDFIDKERLIDLIEFICIEYNYLLNKILLKRPAIIDQLIQENLIQRDGKRVVKNIEDVIDYLLIHIDPLTPEYIVNNFQQRNGKPYTKPTAREKIRYIKSL